MRSFISSPDDRVKTIMTPLIQQPVRRVRARTRTQTAAARSLALRTSGIPACVFAIVAMLAAAVTAPAAAAAEPGPLPTADIVPDLPAKRPVPPADPAVQARIPGCAVWTDRCVTCARAAAGVSCSNIGIACQPQAVECLMTDEDAKKLEDKAEKQDDKAEKKQQN